MITIVTSLFKADSLIFDYIKNLLNQTIFKEITVLIGNIYNSHNFPLKIKKTLDHLEKLPNVTVIDLDPDPGLYETWNILIKQSKTMYLCNFNLDDRHHPEYLNIMLTLLKQTNADLITTPHYISRQYQSYFTVQKEVWHTKKQIILGSTIKWINYTQFTINDLFSIKNNYVTSYNIPHCSPVWKHSLHKQYGYFDEQQFGTYADWEFWLRAGKNKLYLLYPEPMILYQIDEQSHGRINKQFDKYKKIFDIYSPYKLPAKLP